MATDSWASASNGAGLKKAIKPPKAKKPKAGGWAEVAAETVEERKARRMVALEQRRAADAKRLSGIKVVTKRGNQTLSERSLTDPAIDADPNP